MDYSEDGNGEIRGISAIVQEESTYQSILQSHDTIRVSRSTGTSELPSKSSDTHRVMNADDARFIASILGEWRPISTRNVDKYLGKTGGEQQNILELAHIHFELTGELFTSFYQHMGEARHCISTEFERTFVRNGVVRTCFVEDNCLHTIAMEMSPRAVVHREKKFVRNGRLYVIRKVDGLECSRIYEKVTRSMDWDDRKSPMEETGMVMEEVEKIKEELKESMEKDEYIKGSLDKLISEVAEIRKRVENTDIMGAKLVENLSPNKPDSRKTGLREEKTPEESEKSDKSLTIATNFDLQYPNPELKDVNRSNIRYLPISLEEVFMGTVKAVTVRGQIIPIRINPGALGGTQIVIPIGGNKIGDPTNLIFVLRDQLHPKFIRNGADLYRTEKLPECPKMPLTIPTIDGYEFPVTLQEVLNSNCVIKLPGFGLPYPNSIFRGDMIVRFVAVE